MTEWEKQIEELHRTVAELQVRSAELQARGDRLERRLKDSLGSLLYVLNQYCLCEICEYADDDCTPDSGTCVPKWKEL